MPQPARRKVDPSLQYRWGFVGLILVASFAIWYARTSGRSQSFMSHSESTRNLVKVTCPRCQNQEPQKLKCALCGGKGFIWVDNARDPGVQPTSP